MAGKAVGRLVTVWMVNGNHHIAMTMETCLQSYGAVGWNNPDGIGNVAQSKSGTVAESIGCFGQIVAYQIVGRVAIIACCHGVVWTAIPTVINLTHDVAIRAGGRVVR